MTYRIDWLQQQVNKLEEMELEKSRIITGLRKCEWLGMQEGHLDHYVLTLTREYLDAYREARRVVQEGESSV